MSDTVTRLMNILREHTNMPMHPTSRLVPDLGLDSLDLIQLSSDIEEQFSIEQFDYDPNTMETVEDVVKALDAKLSQTQTQTAGA